MSDVTRETLDEIGDPSAVNVRALIGHACALVVAGVFIYAAQAKIRDPITFALQIQRFEMVPTSMLHAMALILPWVELIAAAALVIPATRRAGAIVIALMLLMFMTAVINAAFIKGLKISCGCFGEDSATAGYKTLALDVALLIGTILSVYLSRPRDAVLGPFKRARE